MCGVAGIFGSGWQFRQLLAMVSQQFHRGPDDQGTYVDSTGTAALGHNRLSIIDLSPAGHQPMQSPDRALTVVFNGEIYNYLELRAELDSYPYRSLTDTEVLLAAYERWGEDCLQRLEGMFAFLLWDARRRVLFAARDRFGVKPLYYHIQPDGTLFLASEIKALHAAGVPRDPDQVQWATYLVHGLHDHSEGTFWRDVKHLEPGHKLKWQDGRVQIACWYDLSRQIAEKEPDRRPPEEVEEEYLSLLTESVRWRFRADVPVGINLSGGLDSSTLLGLVQSIQGPDSQVKAYTFTTGDPNYDETPWVERMLASTRHPSVLCRLAPADVPDLAASVMKHQDEPFGGIPTLAYARLFERARCDGTIVLLDGQGMDEQWAGYDYYTRESHSTEIVQGTRERVVRPECIEPEFRKLAIPLASPQPFPDAIRNLQYRDTRYTKIPRALRFNDRISMRASTELREPFLDHRLFELSFQQPREHKIRNGASKWLLRRMARTLLPNGLVEAPKRALQTPQREWLRGPLRTWAEERIEAMVTHWGSTWIRPPEVMNAWKLFVDEQSDNSFYIWQWISLGALTSG